jgi:hypothetical protein
VHCKRGEIISVENYRVLDFFTKYQNKWFVSTEERFLWETYITKQKNVKVLARLMSKSGSSYKDVSLEEGDDWGLKQVYIIVKFADIVDLGNRLSNL